jgi:hypothetical protein
MIFEKRPSPSVFIEGVIKAFGLAINQCYFGAAGESLRGLTSKKKGSFFASEIPNGK